ELPPIQQTDNPANEITLPPILDDEDDKIILPPIQPTDNPANEITLPPILDDEDDEIILPPIQQTDNPANEITLPPIQDDEDDEIILPPIQQTDNPVNEITLSPIPDEEYDEIVLPPTNQTENTFGDNRRDTVGVTLPAHNQLYREYVQLPSQIARLKREIAEGERKLVSLEDERKRTAAEEQNAHEEHDDKLAARNREEEHSANMYGNVLRMRASEETRIEQTLAALDNQRRETVKELESLSVFSVVKKRDLNKLIEDIDNRISSARRDMDAVHSSMEELKKQQQNDTALQNAERELEFARNRYEQIRISLERKESEIAVCRKDIVQKKGELEMCEQRLEQLRKEISDGRT
ncbi:MAG: hypothetical protein IIZ59_02125, partial [Clostridia bacterium]|nr:hypothetical protein [Clostridia bacterium]